MNLKIKVGKIGIADILKFKNLDKTREKVIASAPADDVTADFTINNTAKILHPDSQLLLVDEIIDHEGANAKSFIFKSASGKPLAPFRAGQYLSLKLSFGDSFVTRPYSISSSPKWINDGKVAVTVRRNPGGYAADKILDELKVGDTVVSSAPEGNFYYEPLRDSKNVIALAGGSGITPFLSMAYAIRDGLEDFDLTILFGSKTKNSILFKEELDTIAKECNKVKIIHILSEEKADGFESGFITAEIIKKYAPDNYSIFMCGPEAMYRFAEKEIEKLGLPGRKVRREMLGVTKNVYDLPGYPKDCENKTFSLILRQNGEKYDLSANSNESILIAIERAGIKAPSKCRSGECGWCRSKLLSGEIFIPEENEFRRYSDIENNYIHPCCTFPLSDIELEIPGDYI